MKGIGGHTKPNEGVDTVWLTPQFIIGALGPFDLDPCAAPSPRPWPTAKHHIELPDDGLGAHWRRGRIWLNPPYDKRLYDWMMAMGNHSREFAQDPNGVGIALVFARTETAIWQDAIFPYCDTILFPRGRFWFRLPDGSEAHGNAGGPSALISYSDYDSERLRASGIMGTLMKPIFHQEHAWLAGRDPE